jgi:hypothetical protein
MNTLVCVLATCLIAASAGQITVDATGAVHERRREPAGGSGGGIGRRLPLTVTIEYLGKPSAEAGRYKVKFIIANSGDSNIEVPLSPNPGDLEPDNPQKPYTLLRMNVFLTSDTGTGSERHEVMCAGGALLFGEMSVPTTTVKLSRGQSIHVLAFTEPPIRQTSSAATKVVAHVVLTEETITPNGTKTVAQSREIGSATSEDYSPGAIPESSN